MGKKYQCNQCDYQATKKSNLTAHQQSLHEEKKYQCNQCDYQATAKSSLCRHQKSLRFMKKRSTHVTIVPIRQLIKAISPNTSRQFMKG